MATPTGSTDILMLQITLGRAPNYSQNLIAQRVFLVKFFYFLTCWAFSALTTQYLSSDNSQLEQVSRFLYLDVIFHPHLNWQSHFKDIINKIKPTASEMECFVFSKGGKYIQGGLHVFNMKNILQFLYGSPIWILWFNVSLDHPPCQEPQDV